MSSNAIELMTRGIACLIKELGTIEAEQFIVEIKNDKFDYTAWQREHFDAMTPQEIREEVSKYLEANTYSGKAKEI